MAFWYKKLILAVLLLSSEIISFVLDKIGGSNRLFLIASFLLSAIGFVTTIYTSFFSSTVPAVTRSESERQLIAVDIVFSFIPLVLTFIQLIRVFLGAKSNNNNESLLPLAFTVISVVFIFRNNEEAQVVSDSASVNQIILLETPAVVDESAINRESSTMRQRKTSTKSEIGVSVEKLNQITSENKKLSEMLTVLCENYNDMHKKYLDLKTIKNNPENNYDLIINSRNRKFDTEEYNNMIGFNGQSTESSSSDEESCKKQKENNNNNNDIRPKVSRVYLRTTTGSSNSGLIVKDGYRWRKYGQNVTGDNPSPGAYFKCSFGPSCPVKKKVQRSAEDPSLLVATYKGEHNHPPLKPELSLSPRSLSQLNSVPVSSSLSSMKSTGPTITLDMTKPGLFDFRSSKPVQEIDHDQAPAAIQQVLVQQMASSLTRDPNFTAALAAAI